MRVEVVRCEGANVLLGDTVAKCAIAQEILLGSSDHFSS